MRDIQVLAREEEARFKWRRDMSARVEAEGAVEVEKQKLAERLGLIQADGEGLMLGGSASFTHAKRYLISRRAEGPCRNRGQGAEFIERWRA